MIEKMTAKETTDKNNSCS